MAKHALVTGPIAGRIPVPSSDYPEDFIDVTPDNLYFDGSDDPADGPPKALLAVYAAIEDEHRIRGTHPEGNA
jgi:hypothetical protein